MARIDIVRAAAICLAVASLSLVAQVGWSNSKSSINPADLKTMTDSLGHLHEDRDGVIEYLFGEWGEDCSAAGRITFDRDSLTATESDEQGTRMTVGRSVLHGEFGMVYLPVNGINPASWVVVFQVLSEDTFMIIEHIQDGKPGGVMAADMVMQRCG
jgi:hypothetical protein